MQKQFRCKISFLNPHTVSNSSLNKYRDPYSTNWQHIVWIQNLFDASRLFSDTCTELKWDKIKNLKEIAGIKWILTDINSVSPVFSQIIREWLFECHFWLDHAPSCWGYCSEWEMVIRIWRNVEEEKLYEWCESSLSLFTLHYDIICQIFCKRRHIFK